MAFGQIPPRVSPPRTKIAPWTVKTLVVIKIEQPQSAKRRAAVDLVGLAALSIYSSKFHAGQNRALISING
jgi:hypothetical protein